MFIHKTCNTPLKLEKESCIVGSGITLIALGTTVNFSILIYYDNSYFKHSSH